MNNEESLLVCLTIVIIIIYLHRNNHKLNWDLKQVDDNVFVQKENFNEGGILLRQVVRRMNLLKNHLVNNINNYPEYIEYINLLNDNFTSNTVIRENYNESNYTSYSVNKGEQLVFCLRSRETNNLHPINLIMYVAIHEMGHMACPEIGHTPLYNRIFRFLIQEAMRINIYEFDDYSQNSQEYCGMNLHSHILN